MFKKIVKLFFIFVLLFGTETYSDFVICDSGDIKFEGKTVSEICNGGYENFDISVIEYFTGSYMNLDSGFWGGEQNFEFRNNENIPIGFFDANKKTVIEIVNPNYDFSVGFIGTNNSFSGIIINIENNYPVGFFDLNKKTIILKTKTDYSFLIGYIGKQVIKNKGGVRSSIPQVNEISYKTYFQNIFYENISSKYLGKYSKKELDLFINNLLELLLEGEEESGKVISEDSKNRIKSSIQNSNFSNNFNKLIENLDLINIAFKNTNNEVQKFFIVKYYLD